MYIFLFFGGEVSLEQKKNTAFRCRWTALYTAARNLGPLRGKVRDSSEPSGPRNQYVQGWNAANADRTPLVRNCEWF